MKKKPMIKVKIKIPFSTPLLEEAKVGWPTNPPPSPLCWRITKIIKIILVTSCPILIKFIDITEN